MDKKLIRLNESDLNRIVKESVNRILNERFFDGFKNKNIPNEPNVEQEHIYSANELQWLYDNQDQLTPLQQKVLNGAMWVRARQANYNGYAKGWSNVLAKNGEIFYLEKGKLRKVGT